jgi:hypothetical protein
MSENVTQPDPDETNPDVPGQDDDATEQSAPATEDDQDNGDNVDVDVNVTNDRAPEAEGADDGPERRADSDDGGSTD